MMVNKISQSILENDLNDGPFKGLLDSLMLMYHIGELGSITMAF